jgi:hypothetical protein
MTAMPRAYSTAANGWAKKDFFRSRRPRMSDRAGAGIPGFQPLPED